MLAGFAFWVTFADGQNPRVAYAALATSGAAVALLGKLLKELL